MVELVLKLSEEDYTEICKCAYPNDILVGELVYQVRNNTPLPKGHGDLIDRNKMAYLHIAHEIKWGRCDALEGIHKIIDSALPIIEADKEQADG